MLKVLRPGVRHHHVEMWEQFLRDYGCYMLEVDDLFDKDAVEATKAFQQEYNLSVDGWVGSQTWGKAIQLGLDVLSDEDLSKSGPNWPPLPSNLRPIRGTTGRQQVWGRFRFKPASSALNPEGIQILDDWPDRNITTVALPQITAIPGIEWKGKRVGEGVRLVSIHRDVKESFQKMWKAWEEEGLLDRIIVWNGSWNPRFVRGSRSSLSNHAFATAFDINAPWNGLRRTPAKLGEKGCVRELVEIANHYGWWWGGHGWPPNYQLKDGMHFEATEKAII